MINKTTGIIVALVLIAGSFYGGIYYEKGKVPAQGQSGTGTFTRGAGRGLGGGFTTGSIVTNDGSSITIQMQDGSTKIALISATTQVMKTVAGSVTDLSVGTNVVVTGSANSDGSVTAQSVQIRPAITNRTQSTSPGAPTNQ